MMTWIWALLLACTSAPDEAAVDPSAAPIEPYDPLAWVDPFVGTGGAAAQIANINPGASWPFGMTHVGPDTRQLAGAPSFYHCAGYWYEDNQIHTFTHTHDHGMGVPDFSGVGFMPVDGWDPAWTDGKARAADFSHDNESASPGRYTVTLDDGIGVDITATLHGGLTRVTWPDGADPVLLIDLGPSIDATSVSAADLVWSTDGSMTGYQQLHGSYSGRFGGLQTWISASIEPPPISGGAWDDPSSPVDGATSAVGTSPGAWLRFAEGVRSVELRLAISYVDAAGAEANRQAELVGPDFDGVLAAAQGAWRDRIGRVQVRGGTEEEKIIFHTALFHAAIMPRRYDDVDGRYRGIDGQVHSTTRPYYSDLSLWDTFRTTHPFYILAWPDVQADVNQSLAQMTLDGGALPRWPLGHGYTGGMVGTPATQVLAESWLKGIRDFDVDAGWQGAVDASDGVAPRDGRSGIGRYISEGFVGIEDSGGSVSETLEFAWSDHALAGWTAAMGRDAARFEQRGQSWRNQWYPEAGYFTGRCAEPSTERCREDGVDDAFYWAGGTKAAWNWEDHFVEGNAWHYLWYVPYDTDGMIEVQHGGDRAAFYQRFDEYWLNVYSEPDDVLPDDYYWHGNEPVMHVAFLGSLAGDPDKTSDPARWVLSHRYHADPVGLDGNDDAGTLSSWYLLAATGFFPVAGTTDHAVASPIFERVEVHRPDGTWVVRAPGVSDERRYLERLTIGGEEVTTSVVSWEQLMTGEVVFTLAESPGAWPHAR